MTKIILMMAIALFPAAANAAGTGCQDTVGALVLEKVRTNAVGTQPFGCINRSFDVLSASAVIRGTMTVATLRDLYVSRIGGIGSPENIRISSNAYQDQGAYFTHYGSVTVAGSGLGVLYGVNAATGVITGNSFSVGQTTFVVSGGKFSLNTSSVASRQMVINGVGSDSLNGISFSRRFSDDPQQIMNVWHGGGLSGGHIEIEDLSRALSSGNDFYMSHKGNNGTRNNLFIQGSDGDVGIGTTSPSAKLNLYHSISGENNRLLIENGQANGTAEVQYYNSGTGNPANWLVGIPASQTVWRVYNAINGDAVTVEAAGDVGIGTTNPAVALDIVGQDAGTGVGNEGIRLTPDDSWAGDEPGLAIGTEDTVGKGYVWIRALSADGSSGADLALIATGGRVGIGTTQPTSMLTVSGGSATVAGIIESTSGGFKFPDGTTQLSAFSSGGNVSTGTYNVFNSSNDFRATVGFGSSVSGTTDNHPITMWAKSVDGATQSSGCVVNINMSDAGNAASDNAIMTFTSTTTADNYTPAVLFDDTCAPGAYCRVVIAGLVRARATSGVGIGNSLTTSTTRCLSGNGATVAGTPAGAGTAFSTTNGAGQWAWYLMGYK